MSIRDDFSQKVKDTLSKRVACKCSNPRCGKITTGPNSDPSKSIGIEIACHICAADEGGPRYDPKMSHQERSSIENGIWLCSNCSNLIDKDTDKYQVSLLEQWKCEAENKTEIQISQSFQFSDSNFIWEPNPPIITPYPCKHIRENLIEHNILKSAFNSLEQNLDSKQSLIYHIWNFMNTPKYDYQIIYGDTYGTEYSEFLTTDNVLTFQR